MPEPFPRTDLLRWLALPFAVLAAFVTAVISGRMLASGLHTWDEPTAGFLAAISVVLTAYFMAPRYQLQIALVVFVAGALAAVSILSDTTFPEGHPRAYEPTRWPLAITVFGGVLGLALVAMHTLLRRRPHPAKAVPS